VYKATSILVTATVFVLVASTASVAVASTAGWMVNGAQLSGSKALATTAKTDENTKLIAGGLTITCSGATIKGVAPEIKSPSTSSASALEFTNCAATAPCSLTSAVITTSPILAETTLEGALATTATIKPKSGTEFSTFAIEGENCAATGNIMVNGQVKVLVAAGQDEGSLQLMKAISTEASKELFIGKTATSISVSSLVKLATGERWSFL
jgi:hypothetical protein